MPINSNRYVNITSSVGGGSAFATKQLLLRLFTQNTRVPTGSVLNFPASSLDSSLIDYFGGDSEEYKQAAFYFGFISKQGASPKNIQFSRWANVDTSAQVYGSKAAELDALKVFDSGAFNIVVGGVRAFITGIDLSLDTTYAEVASAIQTSVQAMGGGLAATTVSFDNTRNSFVFDTNVDLDGAIIFESVTPGFLDAMGWGENAVFSSGIAAQNVSETLAKSASLNNGFGTYAFIEDLTADEVVESAVFVNARNVEFMYLPPVTAANRSSISALIKGYNSCGMTLTNSLIENSSPYPWLLPASVAASLDYDKPNASANFMYQVDDRLTPTVTDDAEADLNDTLLVNYYGQTQSDGTNRSFFQRGVLTGKSGPKTMGVHANEQWLKSYLKNQFLSMLIAMNQVPADEVGQATGLTYLDAGVSKALENGSIATGKILTVTQRNYITQLSGDAEAWQSVQSRGYWYDLTVNAENNKMDYLLIYSKRDSVDKVEGRHSLI